MKNVRGFKQGMNAQSKRLGKLKSKLIIMISDGKTEEECYLVKDEIEKLMEYLDDCQKIAYNWISATDEEINNLVDYKYWRKT